MDCGVRWHPDLRLARTLAVYPGRRHRRHYFIAIYLAICLLNANDLKVQNATWSADGYLVANLVAQQGIAYR